MNKMINDYLNALHISHELDPYQKLIQVSESFSKIPYENLTKIIKNNLIKNPKKAKRLPGEVMSDHFQYGSGGTCFSLTQLYLEIVRGIGWQAEPILADRKYGLDTHCALLIWIEDRPYLLDPGYLITRPIPLDLKEETIFKTKFNNIILKPHKSKNKLDLWTEWNNNKTYRLTFKTDPVDGSQFNQVWEQSFDWDMMQYPILTRVNQEKQLYLQKNRMQVRTFDQVKREEISPEHLTQKLHQEFGLDQSLIHKAFQILNSKNHG